MLYADTCIDLLTTQLLDTTDADVITKAIELFKMRFRMPDGLPRSNKVNFIFCEISDPNPITFTDWLVNTLVYLQALPEDTVPIYTNESLVIYLYILKNKYHQRFNTLCAFCLHNKSRIARTDSRTRDIVEHMSMFFSPEFLEEKKREFVELHTGDMSEDEYTPIHAEYIQKALTACVKLAND